MKNICNFNHDRLLPNFIGFDDIFNAIDNFAKQPYTGGTFPPYDIYSEEVETEHGKETHFGMVIAVAGIPREEIKASFKNGLLTVWTEKGEPKFNENRRYSYKGIAEREFCIEKRISPELELMSCQLKDGMFEIIFKEREKTPEDEGMLSF